ncbi:MAG: type II secretion system F family protein [Phycisphaeraceae bacterium]
MAQFQYKARDGRGQLNTGIIAAPSASQAGALLRGQGMFVIAVQQAAGKAAKAARSAAQAKTDSNATSKPAAKATPQDTDDEDWEPNVGRQKIRRQDVITFAHQLAVMVDTGVSISEALSCCADQSESEGFKKVLQEVADEVRGGRELSAALSQHAKVFPSVMVSLVRASEMSGTMGKMLDRISKYMAKEAVTTRKIKSALTYPAIMITAVMVITSGLLLFVLPRFASIYANRGAALPAPTQLLMGLSNSVQNFWWAYILVVAGIITTCVMGFTTEQGRVITDKLKLNLPVIGSLFRKLYVTRSMRTLGTMLEAGVPILDMIPIARSVTNNTQFDLFWDEVDERLRNGSQLSAPFFSSNLIPRSVAQMIFAGEKSGRLGDVMYKVADYTEEEFDEQVKQATNYIEPAMVVTLGAIIGFVAIALLLPIFQVSSVASGG